jgi:hypothetical protein
MTEQDIIEFIESGQPDMAILGYFLMDVEDKSPEAAYNYIKPIYEKELSLAFTRDIFMEYFNNLVARGAISEGPDISGN